MALSSFVDSSARQDTLAKFYVFLSWHLGILKKTKQKTPENAICDMPRSAVCQDDLGTTPSICRSAGGFGARIHTLEIAPILLSSML